MSDSLQNYTGRYPKQLLDALRKLADQHDRSLNQEINRAVRLYVSAQNKAKARPAPVEEAAS